MSNFDETPSLNDVTNLVNAGTGMMDALNNLFSGISMRSKDKAESKVTERMLNDIKLIKHKGRELGLSDELIQSIIYDAICRHGKRKNFENILRHASTAITHQDNIDRVGQDWANAFQSHAENVSDAEAQKQWGALLAGEINEPGTYSKRAMSVLAEMSVVEAHIFKKLCGICLGGTLGNGKYVDPIPFQLKGDYTLSNDEQEVLNAAGLTNFTFQFGTSAGLDLSKGFTIHLAGADYYLQCSEKDKLVLPTHVMTKTGTELSHLCVLGSEEGYKAAVFSYLTSQGIVISKITKWLDETHFSYTQHKFQE
jgi:hypothetical protein